MAKQEDKNEQEEVTSTDDLELNFEALDEDEDSSAEDLDKLDEEQEEEIDEVEEEADEDVDESEDSDEDVNEEEEDDSDEDEGKEGEEDEPTVVETIINTLGYEFSDEELEGLEDTEEGLTKLVDIASKKASESRLNKLLEESPNAKAIYEFEQAGGNPEDFIKAFYPPTDYSKVEVGEDDVDTQKSIIEESLRNKGLSKERIERNLQAIEDSGNLYDEAKDSLKDLRETQENQRQQIKDQTVKAQQQAKKDAEEMWAKIDETLDKGKLGNIPMPKAKKDEFKKFLQIDPETGMAPRDKAVQEMSLEEQLAIDAILFYGLDSLNDIIDKRATTKGNNTLRDKLKANKDRGKNSTQDPDLERDVHDTDELDFRIDE